MNGPIDPGSLTSPNSPAKNAPLTERKNIDALIPQAAKAEAFLKTLASRHRLMILCELHAGERSVGELEDATGLRQSSLSQHLARLRADSLVETRREAQTIFYSLADKRLTRIIRLLRDFFCEPDPTPKRTAHNRHQSKA